MKDFRDILIEAKGKIENEELVPGFSFFVLSKDGRTVSRFRITGETELNVGTVLNVKQTHVSGDKVKQDKISKDFVLGRKGDLKVFRSRKEAISAFKKAGLRMAEAKLEEGSTDLTKEQQLKIKALLTKVKKKVKLSDDEKDALAAFIAFVNA